MGTLPYGKSLAPRPLAVITCLVVICAAGAAGWIAAAQFTEEPVIEAPQPALTVKSGAAELQLRPTWQTVTKVPRVPGLEVATARAFAPTDGGSGRMVIALLAGQTGTLPSATGDALRVAAGKPERATVAGLRGQGYTALSLRGVTAITDVYTFPTAAGLLAVACVAPIDDPLPAGACPGDITSVRVAAAPKTQPADRLAAALPGLTTALNQARVNGRAALRSSADNAAQATAASALSQAYLTAAAGADALAPERGEGSQLPEAFRVAAAAYQALATAATNEDQAAWALARKEVDAAERAAIAQVAQLR
jgi:hypothetical protein